MAGRQVCPTCHKDFEAVWFNPVVRQSIAASLTALEAAAPCASHAGNAAESVCSRCGRLMCGLCRVDADNQVLCPGCFERLASEGSLPSSVTKITDHLIRGRVYAVASFFLWPFAIVLGPVALYMCTRALVERMRSGEKDGRIIAVLCALLSLLSTGLGLFLVYAVVR
ncbi:MAG: hypothetical protein ABI672_08615 [Vicinamibacteria bacterium]